MLWREEGKDCRGEWTRWNEAADGGSPPGSITTSWKLMIVCRGKREDASDSKHRLPGPIRDYATDDVFVRGPSLEDAEAWQPPLLVRPGGAIS
eukprot:1194747-Prorocentrum_minimum.AAC.2